MKFGNYLKQFAVPKWRLYYLDYAYLKKSLKDLKKSSLPEETLERSFIAAVDAEVKKVNDFFMVTSQQLSAKLDSFSKLVSHENFFVSSPETLKQEIEGFVRDLIDLDHYTKVNFEGFRKIMKKHDKHTQRQGSPWFMQRLKEQPFYTNSQQFSSLILKFSKCCAGCRRIIGGDDLPVSIEQGKGKAKAAQRSYKLIVKKEDIMAIKTELARHLPIFLFHPAGGKDTKEYSLVWSCYYDDNKLSGYEAKLSGRDNMKIRFRTFENSKTVVIERSITYQEKRLSQGRDVGAKDSFDLPYHDLFDFIQGTYSQSRYVSYLDARGVPVREQKALIDLFAEVQNYIQENHLKPALSTRYRRTYFQNARNKSITVSLDEDVEFTRELFHFTKDPPNWHRSDSTVPENERSDFQFAVLEIKLCLPRGFEVPAWVGRLLNFPNTETIPRFSKFAHGVATVCYDKIHREPEWMGQLDKSGERKEELQSLGSNLIVGGGLNIQSFDEEEEDDESGSLLSRGEKKEKKNQSLYESLQSSFAPREGGREGGASRDYGTFCCDAPTVVDLKVEPKTFFANERTFIQWASFCVVIQTIGVAFVGLSSPTDGRSGVARVGGELYLIIAFMFLLYALYNFRARSFRIRAQEHGNYDDFYGPFFLVLCLSVACIINLAISFSQ